MLTALFTSSDRQLDTKERRRYELKLSKAPNMRTAIIAVLAFILIGTAVDALARELRVTRNDAVIQDLERCVSGLALLAGPDAGQVPAPGDTCVLLPGTYTLQANANVNLLNLTIRSSNGANATIVDLNNFAVLIQRDGVTIGGPKSDQGLTFLNGNLAGAIQIGAGAPHHRGSSDLGGAVQDLR
jgi:hypothetical protein